MSGKNASAPPDLKMLDRGFGLPLHQPDPSTPPPTNGKARFEFQRPVDQRHCDGDILAEIGEHIGDIAKDIGVGASGLKRAPSKFKARVIKCMTPLECVKRLCSAP